MTAVVIAEPRVYGPASEASYIQDVALTTQGVNVAGTEEARARLTSYAVELDGEIAVRSSEGRRAERSIAEHRRNGGTVESRAVTSSTAAGFTTPAYLIADWAAFRAPDKSFTDQTMKLPLPPYGLQINVPSFASAPTTGTQSENTGVSEADPTGSNLQVNLATQAGQITISQQLFDRGGLPGSAFDKIAITQMMSQLEASVDTYVLTQALANAGTVTDATTYTWTLFLKDLAAAREQLADTAGTRLLATHLFTTSDQFGFATRQVDTQGRPILTPDSGAIVMAQATGDPKWNSWTGVHMGQLRWHTDDNIPASGSNTQLIVARPQEILTFEGDDISFSYAETNAPSLSVVVGLRCYVGTVARYPKSVVAISGATYPTSNV